MPPKLPRPLPHPVRLAPPAPAQNLPRGPLGPRAPRVRPLPGEVQKWHRFREMAFRDALDPIIIEFASRLARPFAPDDYLAIVREIFRWVRDGIRYQADPGLVQDYASAREVLERGRGNCVLKTKLAIALMRALGMEADVVPVWGKGGELPHVQMRVRFPGSNRVDGNRDGWLYGEITIRGAELTQDPKAVASNPETGKLPLSGGPDPAYLKPSPLD
jgi:transglutaminase-like putative cysteine protease